MFRESHVLSPRRCTAIVLMVGTALTLSACAPAESGAGGLSPRPDASSAPSTSAPQPGEAGGAGPSESSSSSPSTTTPSTTTTTTPPSDAHVNCAKVKCVALTFDDGPGPQTRQVLDALTAAKAKATFFVIGTQVKQRPEVVKNEVADGMQLGNHTWDHRDLSTLTLPQIRSEVQRVDDELQHLVGVTPEFLRPPGGALTKKEKAELHVPLAYWSDDTEDWRTRNTEQTIKAASEAKPGQIVLMHDIHESTVKAVPQIIKNLQAKGYHLVTLSTLIGPHPKDGIGYGWGQFPGKKG